MSKDHELVRQSAPTTGVNEPTDHGTHDEGFYPDELVSLAMRGSLVEVIGNGEGETLLVIVDRLQQPRNRGRHSWPLIANLMYRSGMDVAALLEKQTGFIYEDGATIRCENVAFVSGHQLTLRRA